MTRKTAEERFESKVARTAGCWMWTPCRSPQQYGCFRLNGKVTAAHRASYELFVGPIPAGLQIDHLCRVPACVNPAHLEPVEPLENVLRGDAPIAYHWRNEDCGRPVCGSCTRLHRDPHPDMIRLTPEQLAQPMLVRERELDEERRQLRAAVPLLRAGAA